ncbi:MAG: hypothetical protein ACK4GN_10515 [Runella sp.]
MRQIKATNLAPLRGFGTWAYFIFLQTLRLSEALGLGRISFFYKKSCIFPRLRRSYTFVVMIKGIPKSHLASEKRNISNVVFLPTENQHFYAKKSR